MTSRGPLRPTCGHHPPAPLSGQRADDRSGRSSRERRRPRLVSTTCSTCRASRCTALWRSSSGKCAQLSVDSPQRTSTAPRPSGRARPGRRPPIAVEWSRLLGRLAEAIESVTTAHPVRVAVDGPPAAGKTTLADELALVLRDRGREVIRSSIEGFLLPRAQRYRRGEDSPEGCSHDSFDFEALHRVLLDPLGAGGNDGSSRPSTTATPTPRRPHRWRRRPPTPCSSSTACSTWPRWGPPPGSSLPTALLRHGPPDRSRRRRRAQRRARAARLGAPTRTDRWHQFLTPTWNRRSEMGRR